MEGTDPEKLYRATLSYICHFRNDERTGAEMQLFLGLLLGKRLSAGIGQFFPCPLLQSQT